MELNPPKARMISALCTHKGTEMLISLAKLLLLNLYQRNPSQQRKVETQQRPTVLIPTSSGRWAQSRSQQLWALHTPKTQSCPPSHHTQLVFFHFSSLLTPQHSHTSG